MTKPNEVVADSALWWPDILGHVATAGRYQVFPWIAYVSKRIWPEICRGGARFLITAPPQHGKSNYFSEWLPTAYLRKFPDRKVILGTYAQNYANKYGTLVRDNLRNPVVDVPLRQDSQAKQKFITMAGGQMICAGIGGPVTGEGANLFIIDDPFKTYEEAMSKRIRERNYDWMKAVATTRMQPGGSIVVMHTRWHEDDLIGRLDKEGIWTTINLPALATENDPMGRSPGEALCPERYRINDLTSIRKEVGEMIWSALYQGSPVQMGGDIVKGSWIKRWTVLPKMDEIAVFADLTYKKGEANDFTVVEAWGRCGADIYLIAQIRNQMGFTEQISALTRMFDLYPEAFHREVEEKANGAAVIELVKAEFPGIVANNPQTEKGARLAAVAPLYASGNVYYPDENMHPWVKVNIEEVTKMGIGGSKAKNDDTVDVASMALAYFGRFSSSMRALEALGRL